MLNSFDLHEHCEEFDHDGIGSLVSDCCGCYLPIEYNRGEIVICPDCLENCEATEV